MLQKQLITSLAVSALNPDHVVDWIVIDFVTFDEPYNIEEKLGAYEDGIRMAHDRT